MMPCDTRYDFWVALLLILFAGAQPGPVRLGDRGGRDGRPVELGEHLVGRLTDLLLRLLVDDRTGAFNAVGPAEPTTTAELIATCARAAGSQVAVVPVPADAVPDRVPLVWPEARWPTQQRSAARARAAGMPATPLAVTAADVLAWDRGRGEPPLSHGLSPAEEERLLARA